MKPLIRQGLGLVAGIMAASACIMTIEWIGHATLSQQGAFGAACLALGVGAFIGGLIARWIADCRKMPWLVLGVLAVLTVINVQSLPHPDWFLPAALACLAAGTWATVFVRPRQRVTQ